jgi:hypothetical protein
MARRAPKSAESEEASDVTGSDAPDEVVVVVVSGVATIDNVEARGLFDEVMQRYGERLFHEADLLEADERGDSSDKPQFTTSMIRDAERAARRIEYREKPRPPVPRWVGWAHTGHWVLTIVVGGAAGAWVSAVSTGDPILFFGGEGWGVITVLGLGLGTVLTYALHEARKEKP